MNTPRVTTVLGIAAIAILTISLWLSEEQARIEGTSSYTTATNHPSSTDCSSEFVTNKHPQTSPEWLYILGDSSMRMFTAAIVEKLNGTKLQDSRFGSYEEHEKGGCEGFQEQQGDTGMGCTREYINWEQRRRVTFTFKTLATQPTAAAEHLITESMVPSIFLLVTGAHDFYHDHEVNDTVRDTLSWINNISRAYPRSQIVFANIVSCGGAGPDVLAKSLEFNKLMREELPTNISSARNSFCYLLDREPSTIHVTNRSLCEGFHCFGPIVLGHVEEFYRAVGW